MYTMNLKPSKNWVDTHFHVFNAGEAVAGARYVPQYTAALQDWMALAQGVGVTRGVCVQPSFLGVDNHLMLQALKAHPDELRGVAVLAADTPAAELIALHAAGVRGIRLNLAGVSHDVAAWTRADRLWRTLHELGWHLEVHTDQGALPEVLRQLPSDMPLVVDHMAKPIAARAMDVSIAALVQRAQHTPRPTSSSVARIASVAWMRRVLPIFGCTSWGLLHCCGAVIGLVPIMNSWPAMTCCVLNSTHGLGRST